MVRHEYLTIARVIERRARDAIASGCDVGAVAEAFMRLEAEICAMERDRLTAYRDLVRELGTAKVAVRCGVTTQTIRNRMHRAVDKLQRELRA